MSKCLFAQTLGSTALIAILFGCAEAEISTADAQARNEILSQSARFSEALIANDDATLMDIYAPDAVIAPPTARLHF